MARTNLTTEKMSILDYMKMMEANKDIYPEFQELSDSKKVRAACHMTRFGSAEAVYDNDELVAVQGILQLGIGEAWMVSTPEFKERKGQLLRHSIDSFKRLRDVDAYQRIFAGTRISTTFLKHLGFDKEPSAHVWTRKD